MTVEHRRSADRVDERSQVSDLTLRCVRRGVGAGAPAAAVVPDDSEVVDQHLNYLIPSIPLNEAMFALRERPDQADLHRWAREAVRVWLAAYGADATT